MDLINRENMLFVDRIDDDIAAFFKDLLVDFVVPVIVEDFFRLSPFPSKREADQRWLNHVVLWVVKIRAWLHL
jgi:hypothetical protein